MRIVLIGSPHSGKSTVTVSLLQILSNRLGISEGTDRLRFVSLDVTDNTAGHLRSGEPKHTGKSWSDSEVGEKIREYREAQAELVLSDGPGKITDYSRRLLQEADGVLILGQNEEEIVIWDRLAAELGLQTLGRILTVPENSPERANWNVSDQKGTLRGLRRVATEFPDLAQPADTIDTLIQVARYLWEVGRD